MANQFNIEFRQSSADALVAELPDTRLGSLNEAEFGCTVEKLKSAANALESNFLIVDLTRVPQFGAAFLGQLVRVAARLRERGRQLIVSGDRWDMIGLTRLNRLIPSFSTREDAIAWCEKNGQTKTRAASRSTHDRTRAGIFKESKAPHQYKNFHKAAVG